MTTVTDHALPSRFDSKLLERFQGRLRSLSRRRVMGPEPRAAVLVPLCHVNGVPSVLFTKRTETVSTHKGQVSFPGGRTDPTDVDAVDTALRELEEEVGLTRNTVRVLGPFHEAMSITKVAVTPVVAFVGDIHVEELRLSADEIDVAFTLALSQLVDPAHRRSQALGTLRAPLFSAGPHPVWGLTAWIMDEVLRDVFELELPSVSAGLLDIK
jgi:nudix motif 8